MSKLSITLIGLFFLTSFIFAVQPKVALINKDTISYGCLNINDMQKSQIYGVLENYWKSADPSSYNQVQDELSTLGLSDHDIKQIYFSINLDSSITSTNAIKESKVVCYIYLDLNKSIDLGERFRKIKGSINISKKELGKKEVIEIKDKNGYFLYLSQTSKTSFILCNELTGLKNILDIIDANVVPIQNSKIENLKSKISSSSQAYVLFLVPGFVTNELTKESGLLSQKVTNNFSTVLNNVISKFSSFTFEASTGNSIDANLNFYFTDKSGAKDFSLLINQFMPIIKFQLFMSVKNASLPMLNTIKINEGKDNNVKISVTLQKDDIQALSNIKK